MLNRMELSKKSSLVLILCGLLLIGLFFLVSKKMAPEKNNEPQVALAILNSGEAFVWKNQLGVKEKLAERTWLKNQETLETGPNSEVSLEFPSNYQIRISPQSTLSFEQSEDSTHILLKKGDIEVDAYGIENSIFILKDGQKISLTDYGLAKEKKQNELQTRKNNTSIEKLEPKMIQDVLKNTKSQFYKCYTQLLQKTPGVSGQATISFTILPSGRVSAPEISGSTLSDAALKQCLIRVIERVEFPSFQGAALQTSFPIRFE